MPEPTFNQYAAPAANVADIAPETGYAALDYFSANGRIGRLRYMAYLVGGGFLLNIATGVAAGIFVAAAPGLLSVMNVVAWIPFTWWLVINGIKRSHDFNASGWWSAATLIPFASLIWLFVPGTQGANRYGPPPPPNTTGVKILALFAPLFFVAIVGVLAAVAIPAYKDYIAKAHAAQRVQPAQPN